MTGRTSIAVTALVCVLTNVAGAHADVVTEWNAIMVSAVSAQNPFAQARVAAIMHLAVFEAVNRISGEYDSYLQDANPPLRPASAEAAAVAAAHRVLLNYVPASASALDTARQASLAAIVNGAAKDNGVAIGEAAAAAMIALREDDGAAPPAFYLPRSTAPGQWQPTSGCPPSGGVLAHWQNLTPFATRRGAGQFHSPRPPRLSSRRYARDFNEVKEGGALESPLRSPHHVDVARFYAAVLAVGTWNPVVAQVTIAQRKPLTFNARLFALLNVAISDALVAVMQTKYKYTFWRPETAIHDAQLDGNRQTAADPGWQPFIVAPCFPSYGSAHAAASYAARAVAEALLGDDEVEVTLSNPAVTGVELEYGGFDEITEDIDDARVYGGIHFRFDQRAGARQGRKLGAWVVQHTLRPRRRE